MNSIPRYDSIGVPASSNGADDGSEFERVINQMTAVPENRHLNTGYSNTAKTSAAPPTSSWSLVVQHLHQQAQQHLQQQAQQHNAQSLSFCPSMHLSSQHVSNGVGEAATTTAGASALAILFDRSHQHQGRQGGPSELMHNNLHNAVVQPPYCGSSSSAAAGGGLKGTAHDALFASTALSPTPMGVPSSTTVNVSDTNNTLDTSASNNSTISNATSAIRPKIFHGKGAFPLNMTLMLESVESMHLSHIISWLPSGQSFVIHNPDQFLTVVLPKFFNSSKSTKLRSFYRKLNRWGFSILRNHHLTKQGIGTLKGVWHHPDFYRSRAVGCLKAALDTGDTTSFLDVTHGDKIDGGGGNGIVVMTGETTSSSARDVVVAATGSGGWGEEVPLPNGDGGGSSAGKKRRESSSFSLRDSITIESTSELPQPYFSGGHHQLRGSRRVSDLSLGDDSTSLDMSANNTMTQRFNLASSFNGGAPLPAMQHAAASNLASSFTGGTPLPAMQAAAASNLASSFTGGTSLPAIQAAASLMNKRGRKSSDYGSGNTSSFTFHQYQPVTQLGSAPSVGNNNNSARHPGVSASWTAGSTFSQHNFNFPSASTLFPFHNNNALMQEGQDQNNPMLDNNGNVDKMEELTSMGYAGQHQQPKQEEGQEEEQGHLSSEDTELANFFEKFAESLQK